MGRRCMADAGFFSTARVADHSSEIRVLEPSLLFIKGREVVSGRRKTRWPVRRPRGPTFPRAGFVAGGMTHLASTTRRTL